ncbi:hypothetical protein BDV37DRAFT_285236 [Aspergillus pseudonomiae]|uniref:F-box domain-containing protein n=1 Tax=Aspergillus pseudonomiae TaxID=1506151 RepID=A0A5N7D5Z7_9EURO|nr:uncharacterized protein BDV37DRAFT_285236 [Aspergillus pseudonomiae]KAE8401831.1 hypothetical protein BDV37DRAFT_285236 [Aspergillus pseudonomiae]
MSIIVATFDPADCDPSRCVLCLRKIRRRESAPLWKCTFRIIWETTGEIELSGVGLRSVQDQFNRFRVPRDQRKRWDTVGDGYITLPLPWRCTDNLVFFHELCWERLEDHFNPGEIKLGTLRWILLRPLRRGRGSLRYVSRGVRDLPTEPLFYQPSLEQLLRRGVRIPDRTPEVATQFARGRNATDLFTVLPFEIKGIIAEQLNTRDILTLRTVSRAMEGVFFSSRFWRTRFEVNGERGFLYRAVRESSRGTGDSIDWQHLYHSTSMLPWNDQFDKMLRMWETFRWIRDACLSENRGQTPPLDFQGRALQHYHNTRWEGTKVETLSLDWSSTAKMGPASPSAIRPQVPKREQKRRWPREFNIDI